MLFLGVNGKMGNMNFLKKNRFTIAGVLVVILGAGIAYLTYSYLNPVPDTTDFKSSRYSFTYPRTYTAHEYSSGEVTLGTMKKDTLTPYVEVNWYRSDPESAAPKNFDEFMKRQAAALCGADGPVESITCTEVGVTPYVNPNGEDSSMLNLTLVRKNLKSGTTTSATYGPFYVFNTSRPATSAAPVQYSAVFVYPSLSAFLNGTTSPALIQQVVTTFKVPGGVTRTVK